MKTLYDEMIEQVNKGTDSCDDEDNRLQFDDSEFNIEDPDEIEREIARLEAKKAERLEDANLTDEEKAAKKKQKAKLSKEEEAMRRFKNKIIATHELHIDEHVRTYREKPANGSRIGDLVEMLVLSGDARVYVLKDQPNAPQVTAGASNDKGGDKLLIQEEDQFNNITATEMHSNSSARKNKEQLKKECLELRKQNDAIKLWD